MLDKRAKIWIPVTVALIISITVASTSAEESLIPSWIKTIAGFWSADQISDSEFIGALQFLVENEILVIPEKETVSVTSPIVKQDTSPISKKYQVNIESYYMSGTSVFQLITISNNEGKTIPINGELVIEKLNKYGKETRDKKYLTPNSFETFTNDVSGETVTGFKLVEIGDRLRPESYAYVNYPTSYSVKFILTIKDQSYENEVELSHLPLNEGYFDAKTGFINEVDVNKSLDLGPFFVIVNNAGSYKGIDVVNMPMGSEQRETLDEFFRINFETKFKSASDVVYKINEVYIMDEKNNLYLSKLSASDLDSVFDSDFGYVLFEEIPSETSKIKLVMNISIIQTDFSETHYQDEIEFSLN